MSNIQSNLQNLSINQKRRSAKDYQFGNKIGEGSYSTVFSAIDKFTNRTFAIKVLSKKHIVKEDKIKYVNIEKSTLHRLGQQHPGIVQLYYTFQDESSLFFVLDFAEYGELLSIIRKFGSLSEQVSKFYMCQILDAVNFIHSKGIIHRDLKPENILVGADFNLKITDFGAAKLLGEEEINYDEINYNNIEISQNDSKKHGSFVGTAEYVSPELLKYNICGFECDIWAIGCILYQLFHGVPPFKGSTEYLTFEKIINVEFTYKSNPPLPKNVIEIIDSTLIAEPSQRWTLNQIMNSNWFNDVKWDLNYIWNRKVPRFEPFGNVQPPLLKNGSTRNMKNSNSYQQLQQIQSGSDFEFISTLAAKKSFKPPTTIKKNLNGNNFNPNFQLPQQISPRKVSQPNYNGVKPPHKTKSQPQQPPPKIQQPPPKIQQQPPPKIQQQPTPKIQQQPPKVQPPTQSSQPTQSQKKPQHTNLRSNTAFQQVNKSNVPNANAAAAAAAFANTQPQTPKSLPSSPVIKQTPPPKKVIPNAIKFKEISSLLNNQEKILKMDIIYRLILPSKVFKNNVFQTLDDSVLDQLIQSNEQHLIKNTKIVVTVITNFARVFFIDADLNVMLIDLKANKGNDYSMYDYEFENSLDDEGETINDDVYGWLIIELIKDGGDLVFLKRINQDEKSTDNIKVIDKNGDEIVIGQNHGWIDCLLIAREISIEETKPKNSKNKFAYAAAAAVHQK